jgi:predicted enzyme related to lactoylglutathione lyase
MSKENVIDYIEFPARDLDAAERFYASLFNWTFEDYGPEYRAFSDGRLSGGFYRSELAASCERGSALVVFYAQELEALKARVVENGATISKEIFSFPGGRRFHFLDPNGNEIAAWSDS